jgi:transglutaminase-like putative cysteine protease
MTPLTQLRARIFPVFILLLAVSSCFAQSSTDLYGQRLQELTSRFASSSPATKVVLLDRMESLREYVNDPGSVASAIDRIANDHNESTLVRDEANWRRARIALHERRLADAAPIIEALGFVRDWTLVAAQGCKAKRQFAPTALKSSPLATVSVYGKPAAICAATAVYSATDKSVALRFGASGPVSLYVNGTTLKAANHADAFAFDQHSAGVQLEAGWNTIAVELDSRNAVKQFALRITGTDGGGVTLATDPSRVSSKVAATRKVNAADLLPTSPQQAAQTKSPEDLATLAALEKIRGLGNDFETMELAARLTPTVDRWIAVANACPSQVCTLVSLNKGLQADPRSTSAKSALADFYLAHHQLETALALLREVVAQDPGDFTARKRLADTYSETGNNAAGMEEYRKLEASQSNSIWLRRELALRFETAGLLGDANSLLNQVWKSSFDDGRVRSALQRLAERRADSVALEMLAQAANIVDPSDPVAQLEMAKYASAIRDLAKSDNAISDNDFSPAHHNAYSVAPEATHGQFVRTAADDDQLERPKSISRSTSDSDHSYFEDAAKLAAQAHQETPRENANVIVLADVTVERMRANGQSTVHAQQVFYVANDRGARDYGTRSVQFSNANQKLAMVIGRVYKSDGRVIEAEDQGENSVTDNANPMYFDTRSRLLRFPGLEKGDVMELEYRIVPNSNVNPYGKYFGALITFQSGLPQRLHRYVLVAPAARKLNIAEQRMPLKGEVSKFGDETIYRWDTTDLKPLLNEPRGPAHTEIAPYISISTFEDWDQLGRWYAGMITPQLALNADLRAALERITATSKTEQEKIEAIYQFVLRNTNYVAMEFGIYSYKPYPVSTVYARRFGDCKDKASLMIAMLRAAGIDAELALVRTRKLGDISDRATTLAVFNHALAYVPKYNLWLDGTAEYAGLRELPLDDQGAMALTVNLNGDAMLRRVPVTLPMQNYTHRMVQANVQPDGKMVFHGSAYTRGEDAPGLRREYELAERQRDTVRANLAQVYPSVKLQTVHVDGAHDIEHDVNVKFSGSLDTFAGQRTLSLVPSWLPHTYVNSLASLESRTQQLQLPAPWTTEEELHFVVPEGSKFEKLPNNLQYDTAFGTAMIRYEYHGRELTISTSVQFRKLRIDPAEYSAFRDFCSRVEKAFHQEIKVRLAS